jgi:hypothetical protein
MKFLINPVEMYITVTKAWAIFECMSEASANTSNMASRFSDTSFDDTDAKNRKNYIGRNLLNSGCKYNIRIINRTLIIISYLLILEEWVYSLLYFVAIYSWLWDLLKCWFILLWIGRIGLGSSIQYWNERMSMIIPLIQPMLNSDC